MDVVALGELLIDFTENGISSQGNPLFEAKSGRGYDADRRGNSRGINS